MHLSRTLTTVVVVAGLTAGLIRVGDALWPHGEAFVVTAPEEFQVEQFVTGLTTPHTMALDSRGRWLVSESDAGTIASLAVNERGLIEETTVLDELRSPHGLALLTDTKTKKTYLYVAETHQVIRYQYDEARGAVTGAAEEIATLPPGGLHADRAIAIGPNFRKTPVLEGYLEQEQLVKERVYIGVGSSCDVCVEDTWKRAAILESDPRGSFTAEFAGGLRNPLFFAFHPVTGQLWATDVERESHGSLVPNEVNIIQAADERHPFGARRYGWPFCYGSQIKDEAFAPGTVNRTDISSNCALTESPHIEIPGTFVPAGLVFITSDRWPSAWRGDLLVAYHSSDTSSGGKIVRYDLDEEGKVLGAEDFVSGNAWHPFDLKFNAEGDLLVSDDVAGALFRIAPVTK